MEREAPLELEPASFGLPEPEGTPNERGPGVVFSERVGGAPDEDEDEEDGVASGTLLPPGRPCRV